MSVVAFVAPHVIAPHFPEAEGEVCILSYIEELPESVLLFLRKRFPSFKFTYSKTTNSSYYANTCPTCNVISGDHHLHRPPEGLFCPMTEEAAEKFTVEAIPLGEGIRVRAGGIGMGGEIILKHTKRLDAEPTTGDKL